MTDKRHDINGEELDENTQVSEPSEEEVVDSEEVVDEVSEPNYEEEVLDSEVVDSTDEEVSESEVSESEVSESEVSEPENVEKPTTDADNPNRKRGAGRDIIYSTQNANKEAEEKAEKKRR